MNLDKTLKNRATIRNYSNKKPKDDKIIDAIEAASLAPSPGNLSILKYIIVEDEEDIEKIAKACQQPFIKSAKVLVVVCSDSKNVEKMYDKRTNMYVRQHAGAAIENFLLKITDMKLASCWIGAFSETTIKNILKIPNDIDVEAVLPIAYESKTKKTKQKSKPDLGNIVYFDEYKNKYKKKPRKIGSH
tara:strand:- start:632 stop:1195 length:564 start_codon:yes stop_codon:yes gene_type:complete